MGAISRPAFDAVDAVGKIGCDEPETHRMTAEDASFDAPAQGDSQRSGTAPRLYERAATLLAAQIQEGAIVSGSFLTELAVAERFGISRAPARRALTELEGEGLLRRTKGRGYEVLPTMAPGHGSGVVPASAQQATRLQSKPSWERIYGEVEDEIIARISFAGWRVNEARLARHYAVSRTVARDVLARLQQRGLVRKDARSRWVAPALTPEHIAELYELRAILEPVALAKAAPHASAAVIRSMKDNLEQAAARNEQDGAVLDRLEEDLHVNFLALCGNQALMQAITLPQSLLVAHRFLYRWTPRLFAAEPFLPEHLEVVRHLERKEIDAAAEALRRHLQVSQERAIARVDAIRRSFSAEDLPYLERLPGR